MRTKMMILGFAATLLVAGCGTVTPEKITPAEVGDRIGTSMLFAAWNAAIYVNQVEDERLGEVVSNGRYLDATQTVLRKHGGLWFNDESFVVSRRA